MRELLLSMPGSIQEALGILLLALIPICVIGYVLYFAFKKAVKEGIKESKKEG